MTAGANMTSKSVECDLWILMGKLEETLEEISSVALLSPACFDCIIMDPVCSLVKNVWKTYKTCYMFERAWWMMRRQHAIRENKSHLTMRWQPGLLPLEAAGCSAPLDQTVLEVVGTVWGEQRLQLGAPCWEERQYLRKTQVISYEPAVHSLGSSS